VPAEKDYEKAILWAAVEGYPALWELVGELQGLGLVAEQAQEQAHQLTVRLLREGALSLGVRRADSEDARPVSSAHADTLLDDPVNWRIPAWTEEILCVEATDEGQRRYESLAAR
jgi:hypothetical protein